MADNQLEMVSRWEKDKEERLARDFQLAQQHADMNLQKLHSLQQYRTDYLSQSQTVSHDSVSIRHLNKLHSFIGKLDKACQQQTQVHSQSVEVAEQRKNLWIAQQRKRKAVDMLLDKKRQAKAAKEEKQAQQMLDEMSTQRYVRKQQSLRVR